MERLPDGMVFLGCAMTEVGAVSQCDTLTWLQIQPDFLHNFQV